MSDLELLNEGMRLALGFFGVGMLLLLVAGVLLGLVDFIRRLIG